MAVGLTLKRRYADALTAFEPHGERKNWCEGAASLRVAASTSCPLELLKTLFELAADHLVHIH
jgi:hypothetical protein